MIKKRGHPTGEGGERPIGKITKKGKKKYKRSFSCPGRKGEPRERKWRRETRGVRGLEKNACLRKGGGEDQTSREERNESERNLETYPEGPKRRRAGIVVGRSSPKSENEKKTRGRWEKGSTVQKRKKKYCGGERQWLASSTTKRKDRIYETSSTKTQRPWGRQHSGSLSGTCIKGKNRKKGPLIRTMGKTKTSRKPEKGKRGLMYHQLG